MDRIVNPEERLLRESLFAELEQLDVVLDWIGGNCPVQAEGRLGAHPLYFRARGASWSLEIGPKELWQTGRAWTIERDYEGGPFDAGYMPENEALAFIVKGIRAFLAGAPSTMVPIDELL